MAFDIEKIKSLIVVAAQAQVDVLELSQDGVDVCIQRLADPAGGLAPRSTAIAVAAVPSQVHMDIPVPAKADAAALQAPLQLARAPMAGTFYRSVTPGGQALVNVGDSVDAGAILGVLESMKMMNEIESEHSGRVKRVLCDDGALVSAGQPLFELEGTKPC